MKRCCTRSSRPSTSPGVSSWRSCRIPPRVCVTEVPLLFESGSERYFDKIVVITAPLEVRSSRAEGAISEREWRLLPEDEKVARADYSYVNAASLAELDAFVASVLADLGV